MVVDHFADFVLHAAGSVLHLTFGLFRCALGFRLLVARHLARGFLNGPACLLGRAFDTILIHGLSPCRWWHSGDGSRMFRLCGAFAKSMRSGGAWAGVPRAKLPPLFCCARRAAP